jgi:hypothetical protein
VLVELERERHFDSGNDFVFALSIGIDGSATGAATKGCRLALLTIG